MKTVLRFLLPLLLLIGLAGQIRADALGGSCSIAAGEMALDGGVLRYHQAGAGPHILLLHGLFANKEQWGSVLCLLSAAGYTAIAPDLPGYGQSVDFPITDYPLEQQVARLRQFMDHLGIARFDLAGNSMGGTIAALYLQQYPQQVRTLAFIGSPLGIVEWSPQVRAAIYQGINPFIPIDVAELDLELSLLFVTPPTLAEEVKQALVKEYVEHNRHYQQVWNIVGLYATALYPRSRLRRVPALILWGQNDAIFSIDGSDRLRHRFPRGRLVKLPGAGHLPHLENAGEVAEIYLDFLKTYAAGRVRGQ